MTRAGRLLEQINPASGTASLGVTTNTGFRKKGKKKKKDKDYKETRSA